PTSGLDFFHMQQVAREILNLKALGKTIFIVTHDSEFILACCDNLIRLDAGKVTESYRLSSASESTRL
nr:ABC transporter [Lachnospiraceae bacterium]